MIAALRAVLRRHPVVGGAFLLALAATVFFAVRTVIFTVYWSDPTHRFQPLEGWMTPRYVAHSWELPPEALAEVIGEPPPSRRRMTLDDIAQERGVPLETLIAEITARLQAQGGAGG